MDDSPHFRVSLPASAKGRKHTGREAKLYLEWHGDRLELAKMLPISSFWANWEVDDVTALTITLYGSVEVTYDERGSTP